ncbi:MAG: hypothetical protein HW408_1689, partial [Actinobacteria bacterium]|nr:hypothetical protein [Actinomycetota bacterium]
LFFLGFLALLIYSCAVNPVTGKSELSIVSFSEEEEVALGSKAYSPAVQQQGGFYRDRELEEYVQSVGTRVARTSHRPGLNYRYRVLNSSVPNAFALPGGFIVINRGLLVHLSSEAELAAVLGHETGHVTAKHSLAGYQRALAANLLLTGVSVAAGGKTGVMEVSSITTSLLENGFSRDQEREADWLGIDYMVKAGYSPEGADHAKVSGHGAQSQLYIQRGDRRFDQRQEVRRHGEVGPGATFFRRAPGSSGRST